MGLTDMRMRGITGSRGSLPLHNATKAIAWNRAPEVWDTESDEMRAWQGEGCP